MSHINLTSEQEAVVNHPLGRHARVLAVAGSGKTTTLAYRIKHLVTDCEVPARSIKVLMFNRLARVQFQETLARIGIGRPYQPPVDTFHSFSYGLLRDMMQAGVLPSSTEFWTSATGERMWLYTNIAISNLEREKVVPPDLVDPEEALEAISLWRARSSRRNGQATEGIRTCRWSMPSMRSCGSGSGLSPSTTLCRWQLGSSSTSSGSERTGAGIPVTSSSTNTRM